MLVTHRSARRWSCIRIIAARPANWPAQKRWLFGFQRRRHGRSLSGRHRRWLRRKRGRLAITAAGVGIALEALAPAMAVAVKTFATAWRFTYECRWWTTIVAEIARLATAAICSSTVRPIPIRPVSVRTVSIRPVVVAIKPAMFAAILVALTVAPVIAIETITIVALIIVVRPVVTAIVVVTLRTIVIALRAVELPLLLRNAPALGLAIALSDLRLHVAALVITLVVEVLAVHRVLSIKGLSARQSTLILATLTHLLFAVGQNYAVVMLCVLQVTFRQHRITGRQRIASQ